MIADLNKALAEIAITGIFAGMHTEAARIVEALEQQPVSELSMLSLRALLLISQDQHGAAVELLAPWCDGHDLDTPHGYLALALWHSGKIDEAKRWCERIVGNCYDDSTCALAKQILIEIGH